jgi:hypothetical protein
MTPEMKIKIALIPDLNPPACVVTHGMSAYRRIRAISAHAFNKPAETFNLVEAGQSRAAIGRDALFSFTMQAPA